MNHTLRFERLIRRFPRPRPGAILRFLSIIVVSVACFSARPVAGQPDTRQTDRRLSVAEQSFQVQTGTTDSPLVVTLDEAIQIALVTNLNIQNQRLDLKNAQSQVREGWAELYPQIDISSSYTRNVRSPDPFAGSQAGGFFQTLGFVDWLAFNEQARTDTNPDSNPISIGEFFLRQQQGLEDAGIVRETGGNPFAIPTLYRSTLSITQKLFDGRAIFGASGASRWLGPLNSSAVRRQEQLLVDEVKRAFYASLLAKENTDVLSMSVERADRTRQEVARQVSVGTAPKFQRLTAEVELANLETQLVDATNGFEASLDNLKLLIGMPVEQPLRLRGALEAERGNALFTVTVDESELLALKNRPDLDQAKAQIEIERIQLKVAKSEFLPDLNAFLNLNYVGSIPDNRTSISADPSNPFSFSSSRKGYFDNAFWDWDLNVGFRLQWNLFNGFASKQRVQQRKIAMQKAALTRDFLSHSIRIEVERAIRDVRAAWIRMTAQEKNVDRAELNYSFASTRLSEGVASPIEVREASDLLDQSRLNYLQAVHDFLVARSAYEVAIGSPTIASIDTTLTSN